MKNLISSIPRIINKFGKLNAALMLYATTAVVVPGQTFTTLHTFVAGVNPAGLVQSTDGHFYGTTSSGRFFSMTSSGKLTTLCNDCPTATITLVQGIDGNFYGTTGQTAFKITPTGESNILYTFCSQSLPEDMCSDGSFPSGSLVSTSSGLYGTAEHGGLYEGGAIFLIGGTGELTPYNFCRQGQQCSDGLLPLSGLVQSTDGNFYGTTSNGGANGSCDGKYCGTVFKFSPSDMGGSLTTLYSFCDKVAHGKCLDGLFPESPLIQVAGGDFYGTTSSGGAHGGGTIFKIIPSGTLTTSYSFCFGSGCTEGVIPTAALVQATDRNIYGTTKSTIFKITPSGDMTTLYTFCSEPDCDDGNPTGTLLQATDGNFYGTTTGSNGNGGTIFSLSVGLAPFIETRPTYGAVGAPVTILGSNLIGATGVSFHGTPAIFAVVSKSQITVRVPPGASSGEVEVVTPSGTLSSNLPFKVMP